MQQIVSRGHTRPLAEISFVQDGPNRTLLVSAAHDKLPQIRNGETGDWIGTFQGHKGAVWSAKVDAKTRTLAATASGDFTAKLWCAHTGKELHEFKHKHVVKVVDFSADTEKIATACQDGLIRLYNTCRPEADPLQYTAAPTGATEAISKLSWMPDENILIAAKRTGEIQLWDIRNSAASGPVKSVTIPGGGVIMDMELNPAHGTILIASERRVLFCSINDLSVVKEFAMPTPMTFKEEGGASLHPDGTRFIAGGSDLWLREFDATTGEVLQTIKGHHGPIRAVRYHPLGEYGATGSEDATIRIWGLSKEKEEQGSDGTGSSPVNNTK